MARPRILIPEETDLDDIDTCCRHGSSSGDHRIGLGGEIADRGAYRHPTRDHRHDVADSPGVERTESARGGVFAVNDAGTAAKRNIGLGRSHHTGEKGRPVSSQTFDHSVIRGSDPHQVAAKMRFCSASTAARSRRSASLRFTTASCATLASPGERRKMRVPS